MGWAGAGAGLGLAGLQSADLGRAETFRILRPRPAGCGAAAKNLSFYLYLSYVFYSREEAFILQNPRRTSLGTENDVDRYKPQSGS